MSVWSQIFGVITGLILSVPVWLGVQWLAGKTIDKWLDSKFSHRLEALKHAHNQEIERLRSNINAALDRTFKLNQHEFEVLPEVWSLLNDAYTSTSGLISSFESYPDLNKLDEKELRRFAKEEEYADREVELLLSAPDKLEFASRARLRRRLRVASAAHWEYRSAIRKKGIFIAVPVLERLQKIEELIRATVAAVGVRVNSPDLPRDFEDQGKFLHTAEKLRLEVEQSVRDKLWERQ